MHSKTFTNILLDFSCPTFFALSNCPLVYLSGKLWIKFDGKIKGKKVENMVSKMKVRG